MVWDPEKFINKEEIADRIEIEYFTDPLCCWSWAFEPHWRKFINEKKDKIIWRYKMGGMITDWKDYTDPVNDISRPAQMAPLWMQVKYTTRAEIDPDIWLEDPPQSSLPACMAVKCAEAQSAAAADILLVALRKAVMTQKLNIAKREVILALSKEIADQYHIMDFEKFNEDFENNRMWQYLKMDLQASRIAGIGRFPTITMQIPRFSKGIILVGYRPFDILNEAFNQFTDVFEHQE